ncbi:MAG TPA: alkaline phosphatase, partial [Conexibacter sp.]|nr:alkaline phosphatase [Conexibacter sp.]
MKGNRLMAALATTAVVAAAGGSTALATGWFSGHSHHHRSPSPAELQRAFHDHRPKNVILFVGDGMGTQEITAARYYQGVEQRLNVDRLPFTGFSTTWSVKPAAAAPHLPDFDPDSASTGTMWATGEKTIDERISQGPSSAENVPGAPLRTVLEWAQSRGKKVGDVSTAEITDATPAVLAAHMSLRGCQGPANMGACPTETKAAGGLGSIAEQTVDHGVDVLMGGGRARFEQKVTGGEFAGQTVLAQAEAEGYTVVRDAAGLEATTPEQKVLGLFSSGTMPTEYAPYLAAPYPANTEPTPCSPDATRPATMPHLSDMTAKAIGLLDAKAEGGQGLFLQVEGASIDKRDHAADACGQIGETLEFDDAVAVGLDYAKSHP